MVIQASSLAEARGSAHAVPIASFAMSRVHTYLPYGMTRHIPTRLLDETYLQLVIFADSSPQTCRYKTEDVPPPAPSPKDPMAVRECAA